MSYAGLLYPNDHTFLQNLKECGYFVWVNSNSSSISYLPGGEINSIIASNNNMIFTFAIYLAGTKEDIISALQLAKHNDSSIANIIDSGITFSNLHTRRSQDWINLYRVINKRPFPPLSNGCHHNIVPPENVPNLFYPVTTNYSDKYIKHLRKNIHDEISGRFLDNNPNFTFLPDFLQSLFSMYDKVFFMNKLSEIMSTNNIIVNFAYSDKLTKTGGYFTKTDDNYSIIISRKIILETFTNNEKVHITNGIECPDRLSCLLVVFEHELTHLVVELTHGHTKDDNIYKSHGLYFIQLVGAFFGHTEFRHSLNRSIETLSKKDDFVEGDYVVYQSDKGVQIKGFITKMNPKRAVVDDMSVPYFILRKTTPPKSEPVTAITKCVTSNKSATAYNNYNVGDIVSFIARIGVMTGRISKVNHKTYIINEYRVSKNLVRAPSERELSDFLSSPTSSEKSRDDFSIGQHVSFLNTRTGDVIYGNIDKLNPYRASVGGYIVPYRNLSHA